MSFCTPVIFTAVIISSYLLGSIPTAYLLGKIYHTDIRTEGSENVGTMNIRAVLGWKPALLVLIVDLAKGAGAVYLAHTAGISLLLAGSIAVLGHIYPVWLKFKGGKGLATGAGALLAAGYPVSVLIFLLVFLITYPVLKQGDLSTLIGTAAVIIISVVLYGWDIFLILLGLIIVIKHIRVLLDQRTKSVNT